MYIRAARPPGQTYTLMFQGFLLHNPRRDYIIIVEAVAVEAAGMQRPCCTYIYHYVMPSWSKMIQMHDDFWQKYVLKKAIIAFHLDMCECIPVTVYKAVINNKAMMAM